MTRAKVRYAAEVIRHHRAPSGL